MRQRIGREIAKGALSPLMRWKSGVEEKVGYSLVLGVPWALRHLLPVNLEFMSRTDLSGLHRVHVVFDRRHRPEMDGLIELVSSRFDSLPLTFQFYPPTAGRIVEWLDISTFYNSTNTVLALRECETRYAILHDFDLYPLVENYFSAVATALQDRELRFCGLEYTLYDHLKAEDRILGTWCLGMDVRWLRENYKPIDCFHKVAKVRGAYVNLDPYSWIQTRTPERDLVHVVDGDSCAHVKNLCSTYLRFVTGRWAKLVWRLHFVWYLEYVSGLGDHLEEATRAMPVAKDLVLEIGGRRADFTGTDPGAAGFLRHEVTRMEEALHGAVRPEVDAYLCAFEAFLTRG